jgi:hypothetical protein
MSLIRRENIMKKARVLAFPSQDPRGVLHVADLTGGQVNGGIWKQRWSFSTSFYPCGPDLEMRKKCLGIRVA